ncbi:hypothetical protein L2E82_07300 [Cichorium intybus]|uniref:Uncharacterized protein n=1 Tax=Cichorium intybus TaxID=13427 RepID=A0ACB9G3U7_CICIN|nr:hypothetical protein L2E82_07300 [Cichorium intybus]
MAQVTCLTYLFSPCTQIANTPHPATIVAAFQPHLLRRLEQSGDYSTVSLLRRLQFHRSLDDDDDDDMMNSILIIL